MKLLFYLSVFLLLTPALSAQIATESTGKPIDSSPGKDPNDALFGLQVGVPSREMRPAIRNEMGDIGFGAGLLFLSDPFTWGKNKRESALRLGGGLGYTYYGRFKSDVRVNGTSGGLKTAYGILDLKAIVRFRPRLDRGISPFADIQAGGDFYMSNTSEDLGAIETTFGMEPVDFESTSSASFTKGIGGGLAIGSRDPKQAKFVIRAVYNWGLRVKYIVRNSLTYNAAENTISYQMAKAPVRYLMIQVGVGL